MFESRWSVKENPWFSSPDFPDSLPEMSVCCDRQCVEKVSGHEVCHSFHSPGHPRFRYLSIWPVNI